MEQTGTHMQRFLVGTASVFLASVGFSLSLLSTIIIALVASLPLHVEVEIPLPEKVIIERRSSRGRRLHVSRKHSDSRSRTPSTSSSVTITGSDATISVTSHSGGPSLEEENTPRTNITRDGFDATREVVMLPPMYFEGIPALTSPSSLDGRAGGGGDGSHPTFTITPPCVDKKSWLSRPASSGSLSSSCAPQLQRQVSLFLPKKVCKRASLPGSPGLAPLTKLTPLTPLTKPTPSTPKSPSCSEKKSSHPQPQVRPARTQPYEAPYFFPVPGSAEAEDYFQPRRKPIRSKTMPPPERARSRPSRSPSPVGRTPASRRPTKLRVVTDPEVLTMRVLEAGRSQ